MVIKLTKLRLYVLSDAPLFAGTPPMTYGMEDAAPEQQVQITFSTAEGLYEVTGTVRLPSQEERKQKRLEKNMAEVFPDSERVGAGKDKRLLELDFGSKNISLRVGHQHDQLLSIDVSVITQDGEEETTAKWSHSWGHLLDLVRACKTDEITDEVVLRAGMAPAAMLRAKFERSNTVLGPAYRPKVYNPALPSLPDIFLSLSPGCTMFWGQDLRLSWEVPYALRQGGKESSLDGLQVDIYICGRPLKIKHPRDTAQHTTEEYSLDLLCRGVDLTDGLANLVVSPASMGQHQMMACHLQAHVSVAGSGQPDAKKALCSWQFLLLRPVLLQDLEMAYAGYCSRNNIHMEQVPESLLAELGVETVERRFHMVSGYRAALPVPQEREAVKRITRDSGSSVQILVKNPGSRAIASDISLQLQLDTGTSKKKRGGTKSHKGKKVEALGSDALLQKLIEPGTSDEHTSVGSASLQRVVPTKQAVILPTNLFWRLDSNWSPDLLLRYSMMPDFYVSMQGHVADGLRFMLSSLLFWMQLVSLFFPVNFLVGLAVYHDLVYAQVRNDLSWRDNTRHTYLLEFVVSPSMFRFCNMDWALQVLTGTTLLYLALLSLGVAYCNVFHVNGASGSADRTFEMFDTAVQNVNVVILCCVCLFVTLVAVWIVLGSLVKPTGLLPYAIMVGAALQIMHSMLSKFTGMQKYVNERMEHMLDLVLHAIFSVMLKNDSSSSEAVFAKMEVFDNLEESVAEMMPRMEAELAKAIGANTSEGEKSAPKERKLEHDDEEASELSNKLHMRPETAKLLLDCFGRAVLIKRMYEGSAALGGDGRAVENCGSALAGALVEVRRQTLFSHFLKSPEGDNDVDLDPNVYTLLHQLQNQELERMNGLVASRLTTCLDWNAIAQLADHFVTTTLVDRVVINVVESELSEVTDGSAAARIVLAAYRLAYVDFESKYNSDPAQIFVDCGIVSEKELAQPETKCLLTSYVDHQRSEGTLTPKGLIQAVRSLCLPHKAGGQPGNAKSYLWLAALLQILEGLGWSKDEMNKSWLTSRWLDLTEGKNLFEYSEPWEVSMLVMQICDGGLWKAAIKSLMLSAGLCGFAGCDVARDGVEKAGKLAHQLEETDLLNLRQVHSLCIWPEDVEATWKECANAVESNETCSPPPGGQPPPSFLSPLSMLHFFKVLVYEPASDALTEEARHLSPLSPFADNTLDLAWHVGPDKALWHVTPASRRKLRGIWLEAVLGVFRDLDCTPEDMDLFFACQDWHLKQVAPTTHSEESSYMLRLPALKKWLRCVYFENQSCCTFNQFKAIVRDMLDCSIPEKALKEKVFDVCPTQGGDDKGELRAITDLGASLYNYTAHGLWPSALTIVAKRLFKAGVIRRLAVINLPSVFAKADKNRKGVLGAKEALEVLAELAAPGLSCDDLQKLLQVDLGLKITKGELHKYFAMMDVNGDGVLQSEEFVQVVRFLMLSYFPRHLIANLSLSMKQVSVFILCVVCILGILFFLVTLVVSVFQMGEKVGSVLHGSFSVGFGAAAKRLSDQGIGFEDTMSNLEAKLEALLIEAMGPVIGLSKPMFDIFKQLLASTEESLKKD
eukprot:TRINITY_DN10958_c0_g2_i2.p1 TRINITY_DN10958_c0_g2~~TRINITY_DN10958_c0_g2_i2.p1  ORF type:complete len:1838 (+),score=365.13 TRINITY_DN10958_c0_g2_i2:773-5515(+)